MICIEYSGRANCLLGTMYMIRMPIDEKQGRPDFMAALGLLPPYTHGDVKSAYRAKALATHPDRGGTSADFIKIHQAYQQAMEYVEYTGDRRRWIAGQVDCHLRQREVVDEVERLGGQTEFEQADWLKPYVGDFALLAERLRVISVPNTGVGDAFLTFLAERPRRAPYLTELNLAGTCITDEGLQELTGLDLLQRLDLSGTKATKQGIQAAAKSLPSLEWIGMTGSRIGWLSRWRMQRLLRGREARQSLWRLSQ
jgi:Leucine Rich Repeat (LRR) protein